MRQPRAPRRMQGFNLIELMVGVAVLGVLMTLGLPSMSAWLEEEGLHTLAQLRQAAALQQPALAPSEAVQRYLRELGFHDAWASALATVAHKT